MKEIEKGVVDAAEIVENTVEKIAYQTNRITEPYRQSFIKRFPVLFMLMVTFGVVATFLGFERIISEITWLNNYPWIILLIGLTTLILTGTLYKKLG